MFIQEQKLRVCSRAVSKDLPGALISAARLQVTNSSGVKVREGSYLKTALS